MESTEVFCPAKINLFLAVTGRRPDGFHNLLSLMAPLDWGDRLTLAWEGRAGNYRLTCSDPSLPTDGDNLVSRAVQVFSRRHPLPRGLRIDLHKVVPAGAGLGGGSSDAVGTLVGLNRFCGEPLGRGELAVIAAEIGSDCPFFLVGGPAVARGRGDVLEAAPPGMTRRLRGLKLLLCKPFFGVSTPWAYAALARRKDGWLPPEEAERRLALWESPGRRPWSDLLHNGFEPPVFAKFVALEVMKRNLREEFGCPVFMSGSGSTLAAVLETTTDIEAMRARVRDGYGPEAFCQVVSVAP